MYRIADVFIHPTYNEGFPRVILEAMAAGLPIVTTDAGGTAELLGPRQQQFVVKRADRVAFAGKLAELLASPELWPVLGTENLKAVERFSTENVARMYEEVLFS
jgi:glycosyltransferase involved in cell wall biosynthesis